MKNSDNIPELQSPFDQLREIDADGKEWWNSRKLARVMGYGKYWNFERVIAKAQAWTSQKGYHLGTCSLYGCGYECRPKERDGEGSTAVFQRNHYSRRCSEKHGVLHFDV